MGDFYEKSNSKYMGLEYEIDSNGGFLAHMPEIARLINDPDTETSCILELANHLGSIDDAVIEVNRGYYQKLSCVNELFSALKLIEFIELSDEALQNNVWDKDRENDTARLLVMIKIADMFIKNSYEVSKNAKTKAEYSLSRLNVLSTVRLLLSEIEVEEGLIGWNTMALPIIKSYMDLLVSKRWLTAEDRDFIHRYGIYDTRHLHPEKDSFCI